MAEIVKMTTRPIENWRPVKAGICLSMFFCRRSWFGLTPSCFGVYRSCGQYQSRYVHAKLYDCEEFQRPLNYTNGVEPNLLSKTTLTKVGRLVPDDIEWG